MEGDDPVLSIARAIEDAKKQADQNPHVVVKHKLENLRRQLYRMTGGPG